MEKRRGAGQLLGMTGCRERLAEKAKLELSL